MGAVKATNADLSPGVIPVIVGAPAVVTAAAVGLKIGESAQALLPSELYALIVILYLSPSVKFVRLIGLAITVCSVPTSTKVPPLLILNIYL